MKTGAKRLAMFIVRLATALVGTMSARSSSLYQHDVYFDKLVMGAANAAQK